MVIMLVILFAIYFYASRILTKLYLYNVQILLILKKRIDGSLQQSLKLVALDKVAVITGANRSQRNNGTLYCLNLWFKFTS